MTGAEPHETRLKRLHMRSIRRGIKEMDLVFTRFAETRLRGLSGGDLDLYEQLLAENDQDILTWVIGQTEVPAVYGPIMAEVRAAAEGLAKSDPA